MSPTTKLKCAFTLDLDKLNYARELQGLEPLELSQLHDFLAKEGAVHFYIDGSLAWYCDEGEMKWNVI